MLKKLKKIIGLLKAKRQEKLSKKCSELEKYVRY